MPLKPADWPYCPLPDTLKRASSQSSPLPRFCEVLRRNDGQHVTASFFLLCQCNKTLMHQIWKFNQWRNWYSSNKQKIHIYTAQTGFLKKCVSISVCFFVSLFYLEFKSVSTEKGGRAKAVLKVLVLVCDVGMCCAHLAGQGLALIPEPLCRGAPDCWSLPPCWFLHTPDLNTT